MSDTKPTAKSESSRSVAQIDRFKEAARELGTDEREDAFDRIVKKIAKAPPPKEEKPAKADK